MGYGLTPGQQIWCRDHGLDERRGASGALVEEAALKLGIIPDARTVADVRAYWKGLGSHEDGRWKYYGDETFDRACRAALAEAHSSPSSSASSSAT
jgi:hypothetical protein